MRRNNFPMSVENVLPHLPPSLLLDTVHDVSQAQVVCSLQVGSRDAIANTEDHELPVMTLLEVMTQTISVWNAFYGNVGNRKNRFGLIVNISRFLVTRNGNLPRGMDLRITAKVKERIGNYVTFYCDIKDIMENEIISTATITAVVPNESQINDIIHNADLKAL